MADLIGLSTRIIDTGDMNEPSNRITFELSEIADGLSIVEAFSHIWSVDTGDGLVLVDASGSQAGTRCIDAIQKWRPDRVHSLVYTHGHADHVGDSPAIVADADHRGFAKPDVVAHEAVHDRLERYRYTAGWNLEINARQFGGTRARPEGIGAGAGRFIPDDVAAPGITHDDGMTMTVGNTRFGLHHARGETDDHTWLWDADRKAVFSGDLFRGTSPTPATRRRCSATRATGRPRCGP